MGSHVSTSTPRNVARDPNIYFASAAAKKAKAVRAEEIRTGKKSSFKGSVANMSLGGTKSRALDRAINGAVDGGLHLAVAAGNDNKDACNYSPAAAEKAITVGASTLQDSRAYFSNFGKCVDVFAPGLNILSTWNAGNHSTNTISGTSMASPRKCIIMMCLITTYADSIRVIIISIYRCRWPPRVPPFTLPQREL